MTASRPTVFLSSTIYDFSDLRSALTYWLEESGFVVAASEFANFPRDASKSACQSCLDTIEGCQYFILLIGTRTGGRVMDAENMTITEMEYAHALELAKQGRMQIVRLVRKSIWDLREDRQALGNLLREQYTAEHQLSHEDIQTIEHHRNRHVSDVEKVFGFLSMVGGGVGTGVDRNWIYAFDSFRDVVNVLKSTIVRSPGLRRAALQANLELELLKNLAQLLERTKTGVRPIYERAGRARAQVQGGTDQRSQVTGSDLYELAVFAVNASDGRSMTTHAINEAIISGEFLEYQVSTHRFVASELHRCLISLRQSIEAIRALSDLLPASRRVEILEAFRRYECQSKLVRVENLQVALPCWLHDVCHDVLITSVAILKHLEDPREPFKELDGLLGAPFAAQSPGRVSTEVSLEQCRAFAVGTRPSLATPTDPS